MKLNTIKKEDIFDTLHFEKYEKLGFPTRKNENFKGINLKKLQEKEYINHTNNMMPNLKDFEKYFGKDFICLIQINNEYIFLKEKDEGLFELKTNKKEEKNSENPFLYLNESFTQNDYELTIKTKCHKPLLIVNLLTQNQTIHTSNLKIVVEKNIELDVIDLALQESSFSFLSLNRFFDLGKNSVLNYHKLDSAQKENIFISSNQTRLKEHSILNIFDFTNQTNSYINVWENKLEEAHTYFNFYSLVHISKEQMYANILTTNHTKNHTNSDIQIKHILNESAKSIFTAISKVENCAPFSKAFQNSSAILLSDECNVLAKPHLEISIDELEAKHGSTIGTLNDEEILYLQSRGIKEKKAKEMLLYAFEREIYDKISNQSIKDFILKQQGIKHV